MTKKNSSIAAGVIVAFGLIFGATKFYRMKQDEEEQQHIQKEEEKEEEEEEVTKVEDETYDDVELVQFRYAWTEHALLRMKKMSYKETNVVYPFSAAVGTCPYLRIGRRVLSSSGQESRRSFPEKEKLDSRTKGLRDAFHALIREMHTLILHRRWCSSNRTVKKKTECEFDRVPRFIRWKVRSSRRREVETYLKTAGILHLTDSQVTERLIDGFKALDSHLNAFDKAYFFGGEPTTIDAAVFGITAIVMNEELDGLRKRVTNECVYVPGFYQAFKAKYFDGWPNGEFSCR